MEHRLMARLRHLGKYKLLIIDELGYLPMEEGDANLLHPFLAFSLQVPCDYKPVQSRCPLEVRFIAPQTEACEPFS